MPNFFDQFDEAPKPTGGNFFDRFDGSKPAAAAEGGAFFGLAKALPEGVSQYLPGFLKGPSVGEQLTAESTRGEAVAPTPQGPESYREWLARQDTKLRAASPLSSPVATGFATHQIGGPIEAAAAGAGEKFIKDQYTRAVKPGVSGKGTAGQVDLYQAKARDAVSSIVKNKKTLQFTDEAGTVRQGELPKTLEEFGDAIDQTKQKIFDEYDTMARQATNAGFEITGPNGQYGSLQVTVPTNDIVSELHQLAGDRVTALTHPEIAEYARGVAARYSQAGPLSPSEAQRAIATFNQTLKAFYRNPSYQVAAKANVDAMIVNRLRETLDQAIASSVGPGYQELKNQYGALSAIEKDVTHRAQIVGRQEKGGGILGRIADVGSAEEVIRGLVTLNPVAVVRGAGLKAWSEYVKHLRSPNRAVTRLFEEAERQQSPQAINPIVPSMPISPISPDRREPWQEMIDAR